MASSFDVWANQNPSKLGGKTKKKKDLLTGDRQKDGLCVLDHPSPVTVNNNNPHTHTHTNTHLLCCSINNNITPKYQSTATINQSINQSIAYSQSASQSATKRREGKERNDDVTDVDTVVVIVVVVVDRA